jgi:hypothetical protein
MSPFVKRVGVSLLGGGVTGLVIDEINANRSKLSNELNYERE